MVPTQPEYVNDLSKGTIVSFKNNKMDRYYHLEVVYHLGGVKLMIYEYCGQMMQILKFNLLKKICNMVYFYFQNNADNMSEEQIKKIVENCRESAKEKDIKQTEEAYDKTLDSEDAADPKTEQQTDMEMDEANDAETSRKSDRKEKKKNKDKKDKKNKKDKQGKESKEKKQERSDEEIETEPVYVPPQSMFKDAETKGEFFSLVLGDITIQKLIAGIIIFFFHAMLTNINPYPANTESE